jgi:CRISPR-associated protein Cas1
MSALYLDRQGMSLRHEGRALLVYEGGSLRKRVPLCLLERVVILRGAALDSAVLGVLAEAGVALTVVGGRRRERLAQMLGRSHNDVRRRMAQYRLHADPNWRCHWTRRLLAHKLAAQERVLRQALARRADLRHPLFQGAGRIAALRARLDAPTGAGLGIERLRGIEGAAGAAFFRAYARLFAPGLGFTGRNRRPPRDPVNVMLSLGYTLLHAEAVQACHAAGLDPLLGYLHEPQFGRESLAADLVEPFRGVVERLVWGLFRERALTAEHFTREAAGCRLGKAGRARFYPAYERAIRPTRRALRLTALRIARALPAVSLPFEAGAPAAGHAPRPSRA